MFFLVRLLIKLVYEDLEKKVELYIVFISEINQEIFVLMNWINIFLLKCVCNIFKIVFNEYKLRRKVINLKKDRVYIQI